MTKFDLNFIANLDDRKLYNCNKYSDSCGVGFITNKKSIQSHDLLLKTHEALCSIPHRGGMNAEGVGDGAGVNFDLSCKFFRKITNNKKLKLGQFGVANFFLPKNMNYVNDAIYLVEEKLKENNFPIIMWRDILVNNDVLFDTAIHEQLFIKQVIFKRSAKLNNSTWHEFDVEIAHCLKDIEDDCYQIEELDGFYPCSMSARTQVLKGRLNSNEVIPYFKDLCDPDHEIHSIFFHTRFSTNTEPATMMAQPFRFIAHNGEFNTDKKNRLSEESIAKHQGKKIFFPKGQSDSSRLDQTIARRIIDDNFTVVKAVVAMMPSAWENIVNLDPKIKAMFEYFSLFEEKNDGPAAIIFGNGKCIGARLDRLGLRPLRSIETDEYLAVMSEAGQINFSAKTIIKRGRIKAGEMLFWNHEESRSYTGNQYLTILANKKDYISILAAAKKNLENLKSINKSSIKLLFNDLSVYQKYIGYYMNDESFRFLLDPMLKNGSERIYAMGYGLTPNALKCTEGGMSQYFSQSFAQVTNPPLDSIREVDGMTLRVALGGKPGFVKNQKQIILQSPILLQKEFIKIIEQDLIPNKIIDILYTPDYKKNKNNANYLELEINEICNKAEIAAYNNVGIIILSDRKISKNKAAIPLLLAIASVNQHLIKKGLRFNSSIVIDSGQIASTHDIATALGFGASAVFSITAQNRALEISAKDSDILMKNFKKSIEKSLMKTIGKIGLCTIESYIGGEFFESNFLDTKEPHLRKIFPQIDSPIGGVHYINIATSSAKWHYQACNIKWNKNNLPNLGLFKERNDGDGHSFGIVAVSEYQRMINKNKIYLDQNKSKYLKLFNNKIINKSTFDLIGYDFNYHSYTSEKINSHKITQNYHKFSNRINTERATRPAALRDVIDFPIDINNCYFKKDFDLILGSQSIKGNLNYFIRGLSVKKKSINSYYIKFDNYKNNINNKFRLQQLSDHFKERFFNINCKLEIKDDCLFIVADNIFLYYLSHIYTPKTSILLDKVESAHRIINHFSSGAMSYGALVKSAHRSVAQGINIVGGLSNSGEGGEESSRFNSILSSKIRQFASGRFGVWAGYLADPLLEEIEIKIAQGAKPGEGGQLPAKKVTVEIAAMRGATPGVELISPPPHHDTYSIEDLGQLIHDCKATRRKVVVKLVSSEGIGMIAVGVVKAGADIINIAGCTGGTGAAQVTSLKHTGRIVEIGIAEVHQALTINGLRNKVILRASGAYQIGIDIIKSAILGADSFEFGTAALMMLGCIQAKTCNIKCPVGLTTNSELYKGDSRILAEYYINIAHEIRLILAKIGYKSLIDIRGKTHLLHLINSKKIIGTLDLRGLLKEVKKIRIKRPFYLTAKFKHDDLIYKIVKKNILFGNKRTITIEGKEFILNNCNKTIGGQLAIDVERALNYELSDLERSKIKSLYKEYNGRYYLGENTINIKTTGSAGQSYGAFIILGMSMVHEGTCNDGVGKSMSGGSIIIKSPKDDGIKINEQNVLVGNFALFGAMGGMVFIAGEAGDRFAVRNSGAMSVVEGVGDFACEYMVNGMVLNIGNYGKGFANGMSGGNAYQYDPEYKFSNLYDKLSICYHYLNNNNDDNKSLTHSNIIRYMLKQHIEATGSIKAKKILNNWKNEYKYFIYTESLILKKIHSSKYLKNIDDKILIEELSFDMVNNQIKPLRNALIKNNIVLSGKIPSNKKIDSFLSFELINAYVIFAIAKNIIATLAKKQNTEVNSAFEVKAIKNLIEFNSFLLINFLVKECKKVLNKFSKQDLSIMLADKRIRDYKNSLKLRDVQSIYSIGTTSWIIEQDRLNYKKINCLLNFKKLFIKQLINFLFKT